MQSILVTFNNTPALSFIALRNIANYIGILSTEEAIEFLEECGVPEKEINHEESSSKLIYHLLKNLALSPKTQAREMLEKIIIASINPVLYEGKDVTDQSIIAQYNEWLSADELRIEESGIGGHKIERFNPVGSESHITGSALNEINESTLQTMLASSLENIAEIKYGYKLLLRIIAIASNNDLSTETKLQLDDFYTKLFKIVKESIEQVHSFSDNEDSKIINPEKDSSSLNSFVEAFDFDPELESPKMPGNYIFPYIYQDEHGRDILYKPFANLHTAESEMEKAGTNWHLIMKRVNACYGVLEDRFHRFGANSTTNYPHKEYFAQVENTLSMENENKDDTKGNIVFYLKSGRIIFTAPSGNTYEAQLSKGSNGYLVLQYLISSGRVVPYLELAKQLNKQRENIDSDEERRVRDAIQSVRTALKLKNNDTPFITDYGFGLSCNSIINRTE